MKKPKLRRLRDVIAKSEVAHINKMTLSECDDLAGDIITYLLTHQESAEHLFNIDKDEDEQTRAVPVHVLR